MITITQDFHWDAGHRLLNHEGKCKYLHGHRYKAEVTLEAPQLDKLGRVIDFGEVKKIIGDWIDQHWDHNMILNPQDDLAKLWIGADGEKFLFAQNVFVKENIFAGKPPYIMYHDTNPTAENIALELFNKSVSLLHGKEVEVLCVRIHETPNCRATYYGPGLKLPANRESV